MNAAVDHDACAVHGEQLSAWAVLDGGTHIRMDFVGTDGKAGQLALPFDAVASLLMTLPRMLQAALDARFPDGTLRFVQKLGGWRIEQAAGNGDLILKLGTPDGFEVAFALNECNADALCAALLRVTATRPNIVRRPN
jgi:hypothetical protein